MGYLAAALIALAATAWNYLIERDARRSRALYLAGLEAHTVEINGQLDRLAALRAGEVDVEAPPARPRCGCDACVEREVASDVLEAAGPLAHRIVVQESAAPFRPVGFAVVRWGSA